MPKTPKSKTKTYVLMPLQGVQMGTEATATFASIDPDQNIGIEDLVTLLHLNGHQPPTSSSNWLNYARLRGGDKSFSVKLIDSFAEDGPKLVEAAAEGERALRAAGFHMVPVTRYKLSPLSAPTFLSESDLASLPDTKDLLRTVYPLDAGPRGEGVTVAVVDSGVDHNHPALSCVTGGRGMVPREDGGDFGPCTDRNGGHGTHVAGIIGSRDERLSGVAPGCSIRSYRVFPKNNTDLGASNFSIINAIRTAAQDGCDIINLSLSGHSAKDDGVRKAIEEAWNSGAICIAAAGNGSRRMVGYPARHAACIAVSAVGRDDLVPVDAPDRAFVAATPRSSLDQRVFLASFSNIGPEIDFAGPGVWIVSTLPGNQWGALSGTSMAAPAISGFAAVVLSRDRAILTAVRNASRAEQLFKALVRSAVPYQLGSFDFEGYGVPQ